MTLYAIQLCGQIIFNLSLVGLETMFYANFHPCLQVIGIQMGFQLKRRHVLAEESTLTGTNVKGIPFPILLLAHAEGGRALVLDCIANYGLQPEHCNHLQTIESFCFFSSSFFPYLFPWSFRTLSTSLKRRSE